MMSIINPLASALVLVIIHADSSCPQLYDFLWLSAQMQPRSFSRIPSLAPNHNRCLMASGGKKKTQRTSRGWWWTEFIEHLATRVPN